MRKILFLDIDGVLNSQDWYQSDKAQALRFPGEGKHDRNNSKYHAFHFDPIKIEYLKAICGMTQCQIVISSSWRKNRTVEELQTIFGNNNFDKWKHRIIGKTSDFYSWLRPGTHCPSVRGLEIRVWLEENIDRRNPNYITPDEYTYCILDDNSDMLLDQKDNFVQTTNQEGLTPILAKQVIKILNNGRK